MKTPRNFVGSSDVDPWCRFCGQTAPANISTANTLWIKFHAAADSAAPGAGFVARYQLLHGAQLSGEQVTNQKTARVTRPQYSPAIGCRA